MIKYFEKNNVGNDYVVGDIHGCFSKLQEQLYVIGFDEDKDRLFSVGDLVDRGPQNQDVDVWLRKPWFHAVRGNHDQLVIDAVRHEGRDRELHMINGGIWLAGLPEVEQQCYAIILEELPLAIEVDTDAGKVGIVHAEPPFKDWDECKAFFEAGDCLNFREGINTIWGRTRITYGLDEPVQNLYKLYVGHTVVKDQTALANIEYIDTGAVFKGGKFTIVKIN